MVLRSTEESASTEQGVMNIDCRHPSIASAIDAVKSFSCSSAGHIIDRFTEVAEKIRNAKNFFGGCESNTYDTVVGLLYHYKAYTTYVTTTLNLATFAEGDFDNGSQYAAKLEQFAQCRAQFKQEKIRYMWKETAPSISSSFFTAVEHVHLEKQFNALSAWLVAKVKVKQEEHHDDAAALRLRVETGKLDLVVPELFGESSQMELGDFARFLETDSTCHETTELMIKFKAVKLLVGNLPAEAAISTNILAPLVETFDMKHPSIGLNELELKICLEIIVQCCVVLHKNIATAFDSITSMAFIGNAIAIARSALKVFGLRLGISPLSHWHALCNDAGLMGGLRTLCDNTYVKKQVKM